MFKVLAIAIFLSFLSCTSSGIVINKFGEIRGYVSEAYTNEGLISVNVYLIGLESTETNFNGSFQFKNILPCLYDLKVLIHYIIL